MTQRLCIALAALLALTIVSCDSPVEPGSDAELDAGRVDASTPVSDAEVDAGADARVMTTAVGHTRELRGAWVASVFNITWPSRTGLTQSASRDEIVAILDVMAELRMNAVFVQIRPESDALYRSELEPWSRFLSGTQGMDPGWDPLEVWIEEAHQRGIEVHAWMNPYRGMATASAATASNHVTRTLSEHTHAWASLLWMDPGAEPVRAHMVEVIRDVVTRYDIDGVHFDDYFYPYPDGGRAFPDDAAFSAYVSGGGTLSLADWRRDNVNTLVRDASAAIAEGRPDVRFGISPFGIHRPGMPAGITGLDAYATLYCDAPTWLAEGWIDYLAPQLYWPSTQAPQAFGPLIEWWAALPRDEGRIIAPGLNLARLGDTSAWSLDEFRTQIELTRGQREAGAGGTILYTIEPLLDDRLGSRALFRDELFVDVALTPPLASASSASLAPPVLTDLGGGRVRVAPPASVSTRAFVFYDESGGRAVHVVHYPGSAAVELDVPSGARFVSAVDRRGVESGGVDLSAL